MTRVKPANSAASMRTAYGFVALTQSSLTRMNRTFLSKNCDAGSAKPNSHRSTKQLATATEAVGFANTVELLVSTVIAGRKRSPRGHTLWPKIKSILATGSPQLVQLIDEHKKPTHTNTSTLKARIAQIDRLKKGGEHAPVVRAILKLVVIRNEGSHLGPKGFDRQAIYDLLEALIRATLIIWRAR